MSKEQWGHGFHRGAETVAQLLLRTEQATKKWRFRLWPVRHPILYLRVRWHFWRHGRPPSGDLAKKVFESF